MHLHKVGCSQSSSCCIADRGCCTGKPRKGCNHFWGNHDGDGGEDEDDGGDDGDNDQGLFWHSQYGAFGVLEAIGQ